MSYYPPDPGKRARIFYMTKGAWLTLPKAIADDLPPEWFWRDDAIEMLPLKRTDMTDAEFAALPVKK